MGQHIYLGAPGTPAGGDSIRGSTQMKTSTAIQGGCLCGRVRYRITGPLFNADNCHCSMCRRQHGAAYSTYADFDPAEFHWICGAEFVKTYAPREGGGWCFCSECGSSLAGTEDGRITSITLGTVEGDPGIRPQLHIFTGSRAPWHQITDDLAQFEERPPPDRQPPGKAF